jgi:phosphatidylglycerophosphate synthase
LLFYIAGLFDEMDGMLARIKFAESPRGTWLEGFAKGSATFCYLVESQLV